MFVPWSVLSLQHLPASPALLPYLRTFPEFQACLPPTSWVPRITCPAEPPRSSLCPQGPGSGLNLLDSLCLALGEGVRACVSP